MAAKLSGHLDSSLGEGGDWVEGLFDAHVDRMYVYLSRRLGPESGRDATSEVFRLALETFKSYDPSEGAPIAWLAPQLSAHLCQSC